MADAFEPSNAELARRLDGITVLLQQVVGRPEYAADQRHTEHRITEVERDVSDVRQALNDAVKTILERMERHEEDHKLRDKEKTAGWKQFLYSGIAPFAVGVLLIVVGAWMSKGGK